MAQFEFSQASAVRIHAVNLDTALSASVTPTDGAMAADTILSGLLGNKLRVKYVVTGDYVNSTLVVDASVR